MFIKKMCGLLLMLNGSSIMCMYNQTAIQLAEQQIIQSVVLARLSGITKAQPTGIAFVVQQQQKGRDQKSNENRVYLKNCPNLSPEQMSYGINEHVLGIQKNAFFYGDRVLYCACKELHGQDLQYAYKMLTHFQPLDCSMSKDPNFIQELRQKNYYFDGLLNLAIEGFKAKAKNVNAHTLDDLLTPLQQIPSSIAQYIEKQLMLHYDEVGIDDYISEKVLFNEDKMVELYELLYNIEEVCQFYLFGDVAEAQSDKLYISENKKYIKSYDSVGKTLIWDLTTEEQVSSFPTGMHWFCVADIMEKIDSTFYTASKDYGIALADKDGFFIYEGPMSDVKASCLGEDRCPAMIFVMRPTWQEALIFRVLFNVFSTQQKEVEINEQLRVLLKGKAFSSMRPLLRPKLRHLIKDLILKGQK